ncbi:M23 family metallopeptidase [Thalassobacillus devorans]|uniref:M23 family metallopeptidase n=1 Tax=Thalassobacillus devorans TaxID=279813 RepID=UPI000A1CCA63|nr:M23 family metallopeptidase [Thalassobacillus devorans]
MRETLFRGKQSSGNTGFWKKLMLTFLFSTVVLVHPAVQAEGELSTVYHVYVGEDYIGAVDDKEMVEQVIDDRIDEAQEKYENMNLTTSDEINFVEEKLFEPSNDNDQVTDEIENELDVQAEVYTVEIDGETVANLPDKEAAEDVVHQLKLEYTDESSLDKAELNMEKEEIIEKQSDGPAVVDVSLSEDVSFNKNTIDPEEVSTVEEAVDLLKSGKEVEKDHTVKDGETISEIIEKYDMTEDEFFKLNDEIENNDDLKEDDKVTVTEMESYVDVIVKEEEIKEAKIAYETETKNTDELYKGETKVEQKGSDGTKEIHYAVTKVNGETTETEKLDEKTVEEPKKEIILKGTKEKPATGDGKFTWPAVGGTITSKMGQRWGKAHNGIDIAGVSDKTIKAADGGEVTYAQFNSGGYGNKVEIDHKNGYKTTYSHLSSISVSVGDKVAAGDKIGVMGNTGNSTGEHLHFEVHKNGSPVDPLKYVSK